MRRPAGPSLFLLLALFTSALVPLGPSTVAGSDFPQVTAPAVIDTGLVPGSTLNLTIQVLNIGPLPEDLDAWEVHVKLDPSILQITGVIDGPVLDDVVADFGGSTIDALRFDATAGTVDASELLVRGTPQPVDGGFTSSSYPSDTALLYVEVTVLSFGVSNITFTNLVNPNDPPTKLRDVDTRTTVSIDHRAVNGVFANGPYNQRPTASFTYSPTTISAGSPVTLDGSASSDSDGIIVQYDWNFGDGATGTGITVSHTYTQPGGPLTVTLTVTDDGGATDATSRSIFVAQVNLPPVANFTFTPANPITFEPVTFDASASYDPEGQLGGGTVVPYKWDWGDGQTSGSFSPINQHTYFLARTYNVTLSVVDAVGNRGFITKTVTVTEGTPNEAPVANFTFTPPNPHVGETARFDASSSFDPDGTITDYTWDFGEGIFNPTGVVVFYAYFRPGNFTVILTVRDDRGGFASRSQLVRVAPRPEHDVGIEEITVSPSRRLVSGQFAILTVIVENFGSHEENVTVRAYYDSILMGSVTQRVFGSPFYVYYAYITIFWDTSGVPAGDYTVSAEAQIAVDEDPSNNIFTNGRVTILPPPRLDPSPSRGLVGARVTITGTGLPLNPFPQGPPRPILVSFDNQFLGYTFTTGTEFVFVFNTPEAEPGVHRINVLDVLTLLRVNVDFTVIDKSMLEIGLDVGGFYFEGDRAVGTVQVQRNGHLVDPTSIQATLILPNGSTQALALMKVEGTIGLYKIEITIASRDSIGTYNINVEASYHSDYSDSTGHALKSFTVKTVWLSPGRIRTASVIGGLASAGLIGPVVFKTYLDRKARRTGTKVEAHPVGTSPTRGEAG